MKNERPPKLGEEIYVAKTQIHGRVLDTGGTVGRRHKDSPIWHVIFERKGTTHEGLVFRDKGRLFLRKDLGIKGQQFNE